MSHRRDHRDAAVEDGPGHRLLIEGPEILNGSASSSRNDHIHLLLFQHPDSPDDAGYRALSLDQGRVEDQLYIGVSPSGNIDDVPHRCSGRRRHDPHPADIGGNGLLVFRREHSHLLQLPLQCLEALIQKSRAVQKDLLCVELVLPVPFIDADRAQNNDRLSALHPERKP